MGSPARNPGCHSTIKPPSSLGVDTFFSLPFHPIHQATGAGIEAELEAHICFIIRNSKPYKKWKITSRSQAIREIQNLGRGYDWESLFIHPHLESQPWEERAKTWKASLRWACGKKLVPVSLLQGQRETAKAPRPPPSSFAGVRPLHMHVAMGELRVMENSPQSWKNPASEEHTQRVL